MTIGNEIIEDINRRHEEKMKALKDKQIIEKDGTAEIQQ